jgi:hypothetical protein
MDVILGWGGMTSDSGGGGISGPDAGACCSVAQPANKARPAAKETILVEISFFIGTVFFLEIGPALKLAFSTGFATQFWTNFSACPKVQRFPESHTEAVSQKQLLVVANHRRRILGDLRAGQRRILIRPVRPIHPTSQSSLCDLQLEESGAVRPTRQHHLHQPVGPGDRAAKGLPCH